MKNEYNDQELLYLIADGNETASSILYDKYKNVINMKVKKFTNYAKGFGLEYKDLFQEGMVGLSEAINSYKDSRESKFSSFANICIDRQLFSLLAKAKRKKHDFLNESYSLDLQVADGINMLDHLFVDNEDLSVKLEREETANNLYNSICEGLSTFEKMVFDLKIAGFEYNEIAKLLDKSYKSVDSALQRIRMKAKKIIEYKNEL